MLYIQVNNLSLMLGCNDQTLIEASIKERKKVFFLGEPVPSSEDRVTCSRTQHNAWVKVFRINPEFRILRLTFRRKSASKCRIREIIIASQII